MNTDRFRNLAVVSLAEGAKLGQVEAPLFDSTSLHLRAFKVKGDGHSFIVPLDRVRTVGTDAIMVESSQATQTLSKGGEFGNLVEMSALRQLKVVDAVGTFVGTLHDLELDPITGAALRIVVHKGGMLGLGGETTSIEAADIRSIGESLITVVESPAKPEA